MLLFFLLLLLLMLFFAVVVLVVILPVVKVLAFNQRVQELVKLHNQYVYLFLLFNDIQVEYHLYLPFVSLWLYGISGVDCLAAFPL